MSQTTHSQVTHQQSHGMSTRPHNVRPTFSIACWLLALIAFAQLITIGTALTVRSGQAIQTTTGNSNPISNASQEPIQPRSIAEILASVDDQPSTSAYEPLRVPAAPPTTTPKPIPLYGPPNTQHPIIANPRVERLVQEARNLQLEGDMMRAMLKLDEAARIDPAEPAVIYHTALLFEEMGMYPKAASRYQQIQQLGIKAGNYYRLAAAKLIKGMGKGVQKNDLVIGPLKNRKGQGTLSDKHVDVAITLLARPDKAINANDVEVQVHFYDRVNGGEIRKADPTAAITSTWEDNQVNWQDAGNEETLHVAYTIPEVDPTDEHLLGRRKFYGYVVELLYKGEVIDQQAQPRRLHSIHGGQMKTGPGGFPGDLLEDLPFGMPSDGGSLLPNIGNSYGDDPRFPPLPSH